MCSDNKGGERQLNLHPSLWEVDRLCLQEGKLNSNVSPVHGGKHQNGWNHCKLPNPNGCMATLSGQAKKMAAVGLMDEALSHYSRPTQGSDPQFNYSLSYFSRANFHLGLTFPVTPRFFWATLSTHVSPPYLLSV